MRRPVPPREAVRESAAAPIVPHRRRRQAWGAGLLLAGVAALAMTDVLIAIAPGWWLWLLTGGLLLVGTGWLVLAVLGVRQLLAATVAVAVGYAALTAAAPATRGLSWRMLVLTHRKALATTVHVLQPVQTTGEARRIGPGCGELPGLPPADCPTLRAALRDVGASGAWKEGPVTVLETYSTFNARGGLLHCMRDCTPPPPRPYPVYWRRVAENWYQWAE